MEGGGTWISYSVNEEAGWQGGYDDVRLVVTAWALGAGRAHQDFKEGLCLFSAARQSAVTYYIIIRTIRDGPAEQLHHRALLITSSCSLL